MMAKLIFYQNNMTKIYKLLIESPEYPKGTEARYDTETKNYDLYLPSGQLIEGEDRNGEEYNAWLHVGQVENRPLIWELQEDKLDLRSPEAEKMREEARSKRWKFVPNRGQYFFIFSLVNETAYEDSWTFHLNDITNWNIGNCHRTKTEALAWGEKYARYFLTE